MPFVPGFEGMPRISGINLPVGLEVHTVQILPRFV